MKKKILYTALFALLLASCSEQEFFGTTSSPGRGTESQVPAGVNSCEIPI